MKLCAMLTAAMIAAPALASAEIIITPYGQGGIRFPTTQHGSSGTVYTAPSYGGSGCKIHENGSAVAIQGCAVHVQPSGGGGGFFIKKGSSARERAREVRRGAADAAGFWD